MGAEPAQRVLIIGAGSAGLLIAQVLRKAGIPATVFEQDASPTSRPRDWNFGIYWAQAHLEECLPAELYALIQSTQTDPTYEGSTYETFDIVRVRRRPWLELLKTGIDVRYGKKMSSISLSGEKVTATFADGTSETGTLLIGAEGAHSPTREFLFRSSPQDGKLVSCPVVTTATLSELPEPIALELAKFHHRHITTFDPSGMFVWIGIHDRTPTSTTYMILISWNSPEETGLREKGSEAILADLKSRAAKYLTFPFREAIQSVPEGTRAWHSRLTYWPTKPWDNHNNRITLAGDAAHPMTFHRGQGLGNAITDAAQFKSSLSASCPNNNLSQAIPPYEQEIQTRGLAAVKVNLENTLSIHNWETLVQSPIYKMGLTSRDAEVGVEDDKVFYKKDGKVEKNGTEEGELFDD